MDIVRENHQFLWEDDESDDDSWYSSYLIVVVKVKLLPLVIMFRVITV